MIQKLIPLFLIGILSQPIHTKNIGKYDAFKEAVDAIYAVSVRLEALMTNNTGNKSQNFLVSPLSATLVISQLMLGAEGEFQDELYNLLSISSPKPFVNVTRINPENGVSSELIPHGLLHLQLASLMRQFNTITTNSSFTLDVSNALFHNAPIKLKEKFKSLLQQYYNTDLIPVKFSTEPVNCQKTINNWGSSHTNGLIKTILSEPAPITTSSIFANAIYFKGNWLTPFSAQLNYIAPFYTTSTDVVNVTYMQNYIEDIPYYENKKLKFKLMSLPYEDKDLELYVIQPDTTNENAYNINAFSQSLKQSDLLESISEAKLHDVSVRIPKISLSNTINLLEPLKKYHQYIKTKKSGPSERTSRRRPTIINRAFKESLDELEEKVDDFKTYNMTSSDEDIVLSNAAENENLVISNLFQEVTFSINEKGTEAAVISAGIIDYMGGSKTFALDRPFVFFVRHEASTAIIFWGTIADPTQK